MTHRISPFGTHAKLIDPLRDFAHSAMEGLDPVLVELIEIRASQINGCAVCLVMHTRSARKHGESEERIYLLNAWREAGCFSEREQAALAWTEALTTLQAGGVPDDVYENFTANFSAEEQSRISLVIGAINVFNRLNVAFQNVPRGSLAPVVPALV